MQQSLAMKHQSLRGLPSLAAQRNRRPLLVCASATGQQHQQQQRVSAQQQTSVPLSQQERDAYIGHAASGWCGSELLPRPSGRCWAVGHMLRVLREEGCTVFFGSVRACQGVRRARAYEAQAADASCCLTHSSITKLCWCCTKLLCCSTGWLRRLAEDNTMSDLLFAVAQLAGWQAY